MKYEQIYKEKCSSDRDIIYMKKSNKNLATSITRKITCLYEKVRSQKYSPICQSEMLEHVSHKLPLRLFVKFQGAIQDSEDRISALDQSIRKSMWEVASVTAVSRQAKRQNGNSITAVAQESPHVELLHGTNAELPNFSSPQSLVLFDSCVLIRWKPTPQ